MFLPHPVQHFFLMSASLLQIGHHQPPLVLSLSQIQSGGGLLIVNPHGTPNDPHHHQGSQQPQHPAQPAQPNHPPPMNGLTPLPPTNPEVNGHLMHSAGSTRSDTSSKSPLDSSGGLTNVGATSPVSSAVSQLFIYIFKRSSRQLFVYIF